MAREDRPRLDIYARVTERIVEAIERGVGEWEMPWNAADIAFRYPVNAATGNRYRGVNVIGLWAESYVRGFTEPTWATFNQWLDLGYPVKKGEKASIGVFWKPIEVDEDPTASQGELLEETRSQSRWIVRAFPLFNAAQVDGYPVSPVLPVPTQPRIARAEQFFDALGADIRHGGNRAYYRPASDHIQMPPFEAFPDPIAYYSTLGHEATHWSGAESRLNRDLSGRFGEEAYAAEELIAELGAAFLAADLELTPDVREENAAYVQSWLKVLKGDKRAIFTAASHAQRAADYMHGLQPSVPVLEATWRFSPEP